MEATRLRQILEWSLYGIVGLQFTTGILAFFGWFVPYFTEGILPSGFVDFFRQRSLEGSAVVHGIHYGTGALLVGVAATYVTFWILGRIHPTFLEQGQETATTAFWRWVLGWFARDRLARLRFRDAVILPRLEYSAAIAIAGVTFVLMWIPGAIGRAGLALHRINAMYVGFLAVYTLLAVAVKRRRESPYPTIIQDGRVVRRKHGAWEQQS